MAVQTARKLKIDWSEFQQGWKVLLACVVGVITSAGVVPLYTFGPLVAPLGQEFGWSRGDVQTTVSLFFIGLVIGAPLAGWMVGRLGPRRSAIASVFGQSLGYAALANLEAPIWHLYAIYLLLPVVGAGTQFVTWTQLTGSWFVHNRGLALALVLTGTGLCALIVTPLVAMAIEAGGWRLAMWFLAGIPLAVTLPAILLWLPKTPAVHTQASRSGPAAATYRETPHRHLSITAMFCAHRFWLITIGLALTVVGIVGLITNTVPLLHDKGVAATTAANIFSLIGIALIVGRMTAGYLIDRLWAPGIAFVSLIMPAFGCLMLGLETEAIWAFALAAALIGFGAGAEVDFASFLIARYFGLANYSRVFSAFTAGVGLFTCVAPLLFGQIHNATHSYDAMLWICGIFFVVGPSMLLALGPYPDA